MKSLAQLRFSRSEAEYERWVTTIALEWSGRSNLPLHVEIERVRAWDAASR